MTYAGVSLKVTLNNIPDLTVSYTCRWTTKDVLLCIAYPGYISKGKHSPNSFFAIDVT
jgi:hypothetical protein